MFKQVFATASLEFWPTLGLLLFFAVMCGACAWVLRRGSGDFYVKMAGLPFSHVDELGQKGQEKKGHRHE